jgi:hypothetical protein
MHRVSHDCHKKMAVQIRLTGFVHLFGHDRKAISLYRRSMPGCQGPFVFDTINFINDSDRLARQALEMISDIFRV